MSYRWTALQPGRLFDAVIGLVKMSSWEEFRAAAEYWNVPAQNLVYADVEGNIGYQAPGQIPVRTGYSGKYPVPGWDSKYDWDGFIEFDALPNMLNPDSGLVITANNAAIGEQYPYLLTDDWDYGQRAQPDHRAAGTGDCRGREGRWCRDVGRIQLDTYNTNAATLVPRMQQVGLGLDERTAAGVRPVRGLGLPRRRRLRGRAPTSTHSGATCRSRCSTTSSPANSRSSGGGRWWVVVDELWAPARRPVVGRHDDSGARGPGRHRVGGADCGG